MTAFHSIKCLTVKLDHTIFVSWNHSCITKEYTIFYLDISTGKRKNKIFGWKKAHSRRVYIDSFKTNGTTAQRCCWKTFGKYSLDGKWFLDINYIFAFSSIRNLAVLCYHVCCAQVYLNWGQNSQCCRKWSSQVHQHSSPCSCNSGPLPEQALQVVWGKKWEKCCCLFKTAAKSVVLTN